MWCSCDYLQVGCHRMYSLVMGRAGRAGHGGSQVPATLEHDVLVICVDQMSVGSHAPAVGDLIWFDPEINRQVEALFSKCQRMRQTNKADLAHPNSYPHHSSRRPPHQCLLPVQRTRWPGASVATLSMLERKSTPKTATAARESKSPSFIRTVLYQTFCPLLYVTLHSTYNQPP
jgi:hypothetical protein